LLDARPSVDVMGLLQAAVGFHQAGNAGEAEQRYRQVLAAEPEQPDALHLLGVLAFQVGRADVAAPLIEHAVAHRPDAPAYRMNLGSVLLALGRSDDAVTA
jgi:predicted Zn-dependent protease